MHYEDVTVDVFKVEVTIASKMPLVSREEQGRE